MWARASARASSVLGPAGDDLLLVADVLLDQLSQAERLRHAVDQRDHVDAEGLLQCGPLVELIEDDLRRVAAPLQLDHEPHSGPVRLVAEVGDAGDLLVADEVGDLGDQTALAPFLTMKGSSVTMIASLPPFIGST